MASKKKSKSSTSAAETNERIRAAIKKDRERIIDKLFETSSYCGLCENTKCRHTGVRHLYQGLLRMHVLEAIDLDGEVTL